MPQTLTPYTSGYASVYDATLGRIAQTVENVHPAGINPDTDKATWDARHAVLEAIEQLRGSGEVK